MPPSTKQRRKEQKTKIRDKIRKNFKRMLESENFGERANGKRKRKSETKREIESKRGRERDRQKKKKRKDSKILLSTVHVFQ